jgi:hypothetical protein
MFPIGEVTSRAGQSRGWGLLPYINQQGLKMSVGGKINSQPGMKRKYIHNMWRIYETSSL